jgi:hypothetical protein
MENSYRRLLHKAYLQENVKVNNEENGAALTTKGERRKSLRKLFLSHSPHVFLRMLWYFMNKARVLLYFRVKQRLANYRAVALLMLWMKQDDGGSVR